MTTRMSTARAFAELQAEIRSLREQLEAHNKLIKQEINSNHRLISNEVVRIEERIERCEARLLQIENRQWSSGKRLGVTGVTGAGAGGLIYLLIETLNKLPIGG